MSNTTTPEYKREIMLADHAIVAVSALPEPYRSAEELREALTEAVEYARGAHRALMGTMGETTPVKPFIDRVDALLSRMPK